MSSIVPVKFGPFTQGLMNGIDPALLPPGAAQTATNLDLSRGTLRGIYTPSTTTTATFLAYTQDLRGIFFQSNYQWVGDVREVWGMADYDLHNSVRTSYTNNYDGGGNPVVPQRWHDLSSTADDLGIVAPTSLVQAWTGATAPAGGSWKQFGVTFVTADGWESNPYFSNFNDLFTHLNDAVLTLPISSDPRVTARNIYCTRNGDVFGTFYKLATVLDNTTTTYNDVGSPDPVVDGARAVALNWLFGGSYDASPYLFDHQEAPVLSLLSDSVHSATPGITSPGNGIVFAANGNVVRWSQAGFPERWPERNRWAAPEDVRAILSHLDRTLIFTGSGVYAATGTDDNALNFSKLGAAVGVRANCGKTVQRTPFGIVYLSRNGLMLLDGDQSIPLAHNALGPDYWNNLAVQSTTGAGLLGACYGRHFYVFGGDKTVILDLTNGPGNMAVTESNIVITAAHVTQFDGASLGQGLYVAKANDRNGSNHPYVRPWMYDQANARGTQAAWIYRSPRLAGIGGGPQGLDKRARRLRIRKTGTPTVKVYYDGSRVATRTLGDVAAWAHSTAYAVGDKVGNGGSAYVCVTAGTSASSGGPAGSSDGITDGTATWNYGGAPAPSDGTIQGEGRDWIQLPAQRWKYMEVQIEGAGASDEVYDFEIDVMV